MALSRGRRLAFIALLIAALAVSGCGTTRLAAVDSPPTPVDLSVSITNDIVSVSPVVLGAGPVRLLISNTTSRALLVDVERRGVTVATAGPVAAGTAGQASVDLRSGIYTLATTRVHATEAQLAIGTGIRPARLLVGRPRPSSNDALLEP